MIFEWDEAKRRTNLEKHGVDFALVEQIDWGTAVEFADKRFDYGEDRMAAMVMLENRLHLCVYTLRDEAFRIISLRKANKQEMKSYADETTAFD